MAHVDLLPSSFTIIIISLFNYAILFFQLPRRVLAHLCFQFYSQGSKVWPRYVEVRTTSVSASADCTIEKDSNFPSDWWCHDHIFQLERRAVFSKTWMYAAHRSLFSRPGDYITLNIAGFSVFLILGEDGVLRAFHNICRHRAYEVTRKQHGSSTILGCRYHGWSYDTRGRLTKAPEFEAIPEFDKEKNGLWQIHVNENAQGLVFVNLDATTTPKDLVLGESDTGTKRWDMFQSKKIAEWHHEGDFNWKTAVILISRNDLFKNISKGSYWFWGPMGSCFKQKTCMHMRINLFTSISIYPRQDLWAVLKIMPQSATKTTVGYELYSRAARDPSFLETTVEKIKKKTLAETYQLHAFQKDLIEGTLVLDHIQAKDQNAIHALLVSHRKAEKLEGKEIQPAARQVSLSGKGQQDVKLCQALDKALVNEGSCTLGVGKIPLAESLHW